MEIKSTIVLKYANFCSVKLWFANIISVPKCCIVKVEATHVVL